MFVGSVYFLTFLTEPCLQTKISNLGNKYNKKSRTYGTSDIDSISDLLKTLRPPLELPPLEPTEVVLFQ